MDRLFYPHCLSKYRQDLHSFPGMSSNVTLDVTKYDVVFVRGDPYHIVKDSYMWTYSFRGNRYLGGFLPYFTTTGGSVKVGDFIYNKNHEPISCVTENKGNNFCVSGIAYETFDVQDTSNVEIHHSVLEQGNSVYGPIQDKYPIIKQYAQEKSSCPTGPITDYYIWIGGSMSQITSVDENGKEVTKVRIRRGGLLCDEYYEVDAFSTNN